MNGSNTACIAPWKFGLVLFLSVTVSIGIFALLLAVLHVIPYPWTVYFTAFGFGPFYLPVAKAGLRIVMALSNSSFPLFALTFVAVAMMNVTPLVAMVSFVSSLVYRRHRFKGTREGDALDGQADRSVGAVPQQRDTAGYSLRERNLPLFVAGCLLSLTLLLGIVAYLIPIDLYPLGLLLGATTCLLFIIAATFSITGLMIRLTTPEAR